MKVKFIFFVLSCILTKTLCEHILIFAPVTSPSETILFYALAEGLASRDHDVTVMTTIPPPYSNPKVKFFYPEEYKIYSEKIFKEFDRDVLKERIKSGSAIDESNISFFNGTLKADFAEALVKTRDVKHFLRTAKVDLIILKGGLNTHGLAFVSILKCPFIYADGSGYYPWHSASSGNSYAVSTAPTALSKMTTPFGFWDRIENAYDNIRFQLARNSMADEVEKRLRVVLKDFDLKPFDEVDKNVSLVFSYRPNSLEFLRPFYPNVKSFGCIHCRKAKPIPKHMSDFIESSKDGFFMFSLGSYVKIHGNIDYIKNVFFKAFEQLPNYKFLVKLDKDMTNEEIRAPPNVLLSRYFPLQDVIGRPDCLGFLTHCGLFSTMEAVYHAVPMIGMPLFWDQNYNANIIQKTGAGIKLEIKGLTSDVVVQALKELLIDKKYKQAVQHQSNLLRDQPMAPLDSMVYWTEYVIRHKGADHLRPIDAMNMPWYQLWMVDAVVLFGFTFLIFSFIVVKFVKLLKSNGGTKKVKNE